jgi:hypothetical protein
MDYQKHYSALIERAKNRIIDGYTEQHHIIPNCFFKNSSRRNTKHSSFAGWLDGNRDDKSNLVNLTPEEHYVAHQLLVKIYPNNLALLFAANMMGNTRKGNKCYGWLKRKHSDRMKNLPIEIRLKISKALKGRKVSPETRQKISKSKKINNAIRKN